MANQEHLEILNQGVEIWNAWRRENQDIRVDLKEADLTKVNLSGADLSKVNLIKANLSEAILNGTSLREAKLNEANLSKAKLHKAYLFMADLSKTNLSGAELLGTVLMDTNLSNANLSGAILVQALLGGANLNGADLLKAQLFGADFREANLSNADLSEANLCETNFRWTNLSNADLKGADLTSAVLIETNLNSANLTGCTIYGISAWNVHLQDAVQANLIITHPGQPTITVDNLEVAQFIYLLLNNVKIRNVIDTITSKVVLILGRFTNERKKVLDAIRDELRKHNYSPVLFDFEKPANRDVTETVSTLAHMARFVIADITEPKSIPQELQTIIPHLPSVPIQPLLQVSDCEYGMYEHFISYPWVQPIYYYRNLDELLHSIQEHIIDPAEKKVRELAIEKAKRLEKP